MSSTAMEDIRALYMTQNSVFTSPSWVSMHLGGLLCWHPRNEVSGIKDPMGIFSILIFSLKYVQSIMKNACLLYFRYSVICPISVGGDFFYLSMIFSIKQ